MRKIIVNSTPLIALSKAGNIELLHKMYGDITVPEAVFKEITAKNDVVEREIKNSDWIHIEAINDVKSKRMYSAKLHAGEVEVMILAQEYEGEHLVVIDDYAARKTAEFLRLNLTGTIGILLKAKKQGYIKEIMPIITEMEENKIYFSDELINMVRKVAEE